MKIAVISDTHDNILNLENTLQLIKQHACETIIHCGDFCASFTASMVASLDLPTYACFGNNDEDHYAISQKLNAVRLWPLSQEFAEIELDGKKIAFSHYPKLGGLLAKTGDYSAVFHGHTHKAYQERVGDTLLANPGSICGIIGGKPGPASFGVYNTTDNSFQLIHL